LLSTANLLQISGTVHHDRSLPRQNAFAPPVHHEFGGKSELFFRTVPFGFANPRLSEA